MSDLRHWSREFLFEFIEMYRSYPCLWNVKAIEYRNRAKKRAAYEILLKKYREVEPAAVRHTVVKKINSIRSVFKKELNKVIKSQRSGAGEEDVYRPTLFYYDKLSFLIEQQVVSLNKSSSDQDEDSEIDEDRESISVEQAKEPDTFKLEDGDSISPPNRERQHSPARLSFDSSITNNMNNKKKRQRSIELDKTSDELQPVGEKLKSQGQDDAFDIFGKHIANKLRRLEKMQNIFAQKLISDALFEAEMESLTRNCKVVPN